MNFSSNSFSLLKRTLGLGLFLLPMACIVDTTGSTDGNSTESSSGDGDGDTTTDSDSNSDSDSDSNSDSDSDTETATDTDPATDTDDPPCPPGTFGCPCNGGLCDAGLMCVDGTCELGDDPCTPGTEDCECDMNGECQAGLECVDNNCEPVPLPEGPHDNCGWDGGNEWYACGFTAENPQVPIACTSTLVPGTECPMELTVVGCCEEETGNNYWCQGGTVAGEQCGEDPLNMGGGGETGTDTGTDTGMDTGTEETGGEPLGFAADIYPIIEANCSCHTGGMPAGLAMPDADTAYANLVDVDATSGNNNVRVVTGDAGNSFLLDKLNGDLMGMEGAQMPLNGMPLVQEDIDTIAAWIDGGANP